MSRLFQGDACTILRTLKEESVQCVITSPPYFGLRDYKIPPQVWGGVATCAHTWHEVVIEDKQHQWKPGHGGLQDRNVVAGQTNRKHEQAFCHCGAWRGSLGLEPTPELYVEHLVTVFREVRRVLRKDGTLWLNLGDSYTSGNRATYRSGVSDNKGHQVQDDMPRPLTPHKLKPKDRLGMPHRVVFALQADGWWWRDEIVWSKPNPMPASVTDRTTMSHEFLFMLTKAKTYFYDQDAIREPATCDRQRGTATYSHVPNGGDNAGLSRKKVRSPAGWKTGAGSHGSIHQDGREQAVSYVDLDGLSRNRRSVWEIATQPYPEAHFASFPEKLVEPCILAGSKPSDTVLDPFCGSGTVLAVAQRFGRQAIGIELNPDYIVLAELRLAAISEALPFSVVPS